MYVRIRRAIVTQTRGSSIRRVAIPPGSPLDRLLRYKPSISHEEDQRAMDGQLGSEALKEGMPDEKGDLMELGTDPSNPLFKVGKSLLKLGKIHYRHIETMPEWMASRQQAVCSHRTPAQIRRCLANWMVQPDRELQQRYRDRRLTWRLNVKEEDVEKYMAKTVTYGPEEAVAYSAYFMPSRFNITKRVLLEIQQLLPTFQPTRMLDFGCGPGTAGCAAAAVWNAKAIAALGAESPKPSSDQEDLDPASLMRGRVKVDGDGDGDGDGNGNGNGGLGGVQKYTGVDMSRAMLDAAKVMMTGLVPSNNVVFWDRSLELVKRAASRDDRFDLVVCSYTLSEMVNDPTRRAAVQLMYELLDVGGLLVIVEPGNPFGSHTTRTARQFILDTFGPAEAVTSHGSSRLKGRGREDAGVDGESNMAQGGGNSKHNPQRRNDKDGYEGPSPPAKILSAPTGFTHADTRAAVVAPCSHDGACPLARGTWCSFSQRVHSAMIRKGFEEKFSYVVIQKTLATRPKASETGKTHTPPMQASALDSKMGEWVASARNRPSADGPSASSLSLSLKVPTPLEILSEAVEQEPEDMPAFLDHLVDTHDIDWETYSPPLRREEWGRILRSPIKSKGHVTLDLCVPSGAVTRTVLSRGNMLQMPSLYTAMRKTTWGGLFPVLLEEEERSPLAVKSAGAVSRVRSFDGAELSDLIDSQTNDSNKKSTNADGHGYGNSGVKNHSKDRGKGQQESRERGGRGGRMVGVESNKEFARSEAELLVRGGGSSRGNSRGNSSSSNTIRDLVAEKMATADVGSGEIRKVGRVKPPKAVRRIKKGSEEEEEE